MIEWNELKTNACDTNRESFFHEAIIKLINSSLITLFPMNYSIPSFISMLLYLYAYAYSSLFSWGFSWNEKIIS